MGVPQDPRRTGQPGSEGSGVDGVGDSEECRHRPRTAPNRAALVTVPALPGGADPGAAFFTAGLLDGTQAYVLAVTGHATGASARSEEHTSELPSLRHLVCRL